MTDSVIVSLIAIGSDKHRLQNAQHEAARKLLHYDGEVYPHDGCAITLSTLLQEAGKTDLPDTYQAIALGKLLEKSGWTRVPIGQQQAGDVGSTCGPTAHHGTDHIYLVVKTLNHDEMVIADNQQPQPHFRWASGKGGKSPTRFFLRAPQETSDAHPVESAAYRLSRPDAGIIPNPQWRPNMNFTAILSLLSYLPQIVSYLPTVQSIIARGISINAIEQDITEPKVVSFFKGIAEQFFPAVRPELKVAAGAAMHAPDYVMKIQRLLNQVVSPTPNLDVDGQYGPKTMAAVEQYQQAKGLVVDQFAGDSTMAALMADTVKTVPTALGGAGAEANTVAVQAPVVTPAQAAPVAAS